MPKILLESLKQPGITREFTRRDAKVLVAIGSWRYATRVMEPGEPGFYQPAVMFASSAADRAAKEAGLRPESFNDRTGNGRDGAFTKADVQAIVESLQ